MKSNNTIFRELMRKHELTRPFVAKLIKVSLNTVDRWLTPATLKGKPNPSHRRMTDARLDHFRQSLDRYLESDACDEPTDRRYRRAG